MLVKCFFQLQTTIDMMADGPGRRLRKNVANVRRHIDYIANVLNYVEVSLPRVFVHR